MTAPAPAPRTHRARDFDPEELVEAKGATRVSVCLPARDEEATVGTVVAAIVAELVRARPLVDEVLVIDDGSTDATLAVARRAGARALAAADVLPGCGPGTGKGEALWKSLAASEGDVVVWCDADLRGFDATFVTGLLGPLLTDESVPFVKGCYERPLEGRPKEGGRVTELVARPLVALLFPHLAGFLQPLAGEYAGRRSVLERVPFPQGYGVDLGLLVDVAAQVGVGAMAQVDLGVRVHRNRSLDDLGPQALAVLRTALARAGVPVSASSVLPTRQGGPPVVVDDGERPPLVEVPGYRRRAPDRRAPDRRAPSWRGPPTAG